MHISNRFVIICNIQLVIQMLKIDHIIKSLNTGPFNGKIGYRLQIALFFLFYQNFRPQPPGLFRPLPPPLI